MTTPIRDSTGFAIHQERVTGIRGMMKFANGHNYCTAYNDGTARDAEIAVVAPDGSWATRDMWAGAIGVDCNDDVVGYVTVDQLVALLAHIREWGPCE